MFRAWLLEIERLGQDREGFLAPMGDCPMTIAKRFASTSNSQVAFITLALALPSAWTGGALLIDAARASDVVVSSGDTVGQQNLNDADDTLLVEDGGTVTNASDAVTMNQSDQVTTNKGLIESTGDDGIDLNSATDAEIDNSGKITAGDNGIELSGSNNARIANSGEIIAEDKGIEVDNSDGVEITNSGTIESASDNGIFVDDDADNVKITNSGEVVNIGNDDAIEIEGDNALIDNSGSIAGIRSGIYVDESADGTVIKNGGSISSTSDEGIEILGDNTMVYNESNGSISSEDGGGILVDDRADGTQIYNLGQISSMGDEGVEIQGINTMINNMGSIVAEDGNGILVSSSADATEINNNGSIVSVDKHAVYNRGANTTVNLGAPAFLGGELDFGTDTDLSITTGPSHSVLWNIDPSQLDVVTLGGSVPYFYSAGTGPGGEDQFLTFDPSVFGGSVNQLGDLTGQLSDVGRNGLLAGSSNSMNNGVSTFGLVNTAKSKNRAQTFAPSSRWWISGFGGSFDHEGDNATLDRDVDQAGVAIGYSWMHSSGTQLGLMTGYVNGSLDVDSRWAPSHNVDSDGWFVGLNGRRDIGAFILDIGLIGGWQQNDSSRFVNNNLAPMGVSYATASYDSWFLSPEASISMNIDRGNGWVVTPTGRLRYAMQSLDGYTENGGGSANATVADRDIAMLEASAEIAATKTLDFGTITGRIGYVFRTSTGDDAVNVTMLGATNSLGFGDTDSDAAYLGMSANFNVTATSMLVLDGQAFFSGDMNGYQGMAKFVASF